MRNHYFTLKTWKTTEKPLEKIGNDQKPLKAVGNHQKSVKSIRSHGKITDIQVKNETLISIGFQWILLSFLVSDNFQFFQ
jgi:hypothetical protein